jgi:virulence plasmid B protein
VHEFSLEACLVADPVPRHDCKVDAAPGAAIIRMPLLFSRKRAVLSPWLALQRRSSAGDSTFGEGWPLAGFPTVGTDSRKALLIHDSRDTYVDDGTDEFVPALVQGGKEPAPRALERGEYWPCVRRRQVERRHFRSFALECWGGAATTLPYGGRYALTAIGISTPLASSSWRSMTGPGSMIGDLSSEELKRLHPSCQAAQPLDAEE